MMASDPITPTSERALEMGWVCTTTLMADSTAISAKTTNRITSGLITATSRKPGNQQTGHQQIQHRDREKELPGEAHQLVVSEPRQRAPNPYKGEENHARLGAEPEQGQQPALHHRKQKNAGNRQKDQPEHRERGLVAPARGVGAVIEGNQSGD